MSSPAIKNKIIAIIGTTASGKTRLGVELAAKFNGEIVSADSRQVYRRMDIGTGKDLAEFQISDFRFQNDSASLDCDKKISKVPYHMIDIVDPNNEFSLADYQRLAYEAIDEILSRGKLPIIVGGSGLYLQAVIDGYKLPDVKPDLKKRQETEKKTAVELFRDLEKINLKFAARLNNSDKNNKRRLIRYLETQTAEGKTQIATDARQIAADIIGSSTERYKTLVIGLSRPQEELEKRIYKRLIERLEKEDMVGEVDRLHSSGLGWQRLESFGLEYKYIAHYLQEKLDYDDMVEQLFIAIKKFAKRQMTWFRRWEKQGREIAWIDDAGNAIDLVKNFISDGIKT